MQRAARRQAPSQFSRASLRRFSFRDYELRLFGRPPTTSRLGLLGGAGTARIEGLRSSPVAAEAARRNLIERCIAHASLRENQTYIVGGNMIAGQMRCHR